MLKRGALAGERQPWKKRKGKQKEKKPPEKGSAKTWGTT